MHNTIKFTQIFAAMCGLAALASCNKGGDDTPPRKPVPAPTELRAKNVRDVSATLSWSGETSSYEVVVGDGAAKTVDAKTFAATGLTPETDHTWKVRAIDGDRYSDWVDGPSFRTQAVGTVAPDAPTELWTEQVRDVSARLCWNGSAAVYELSIGSSPATTVYGNFHDATGLIPSSNYVWKVRARSGDIYSDWVDGMPFKTLASGTEPPAVPTDLAISNITNTSATFTWSGTTAYYEITVGMISRTVNARTFTAEWLTPGTKYGWAVRAIDGDRLSDYADGDEFTTTGTPVQYTHTWQRADFLRYPGSDMQNYYLRFYDVGMATDGYGYTLEVDMYAAGDDRVMTDGTYTVGASGGFRIDPRYGGYVSHENYVVGTKDKLAGGTVTVTGLGEEIYRVSTDLVTESGVVMTSEYSGFLPYLSGSR
jgi:hypothetical protein